MNLVLHQNCPPREEGVDGVSAGLVLLDIDGTENGISDNRVVEERVLGESRVRGIDGKVGFGTLAAAERDLAMTVPLDKSD